MCVVVYLGSFVDFVSLDKRCGDTFYNWYWRRELRLQYGILPVVLHCVHYIKVITDFSEVYLYLSISLSRVYVRILIRQPIIITVKAYN